MTYGFDGNAPSAAASALSDQTRRAIVERLARSSASVRAITDDLPVSQPAVSQHLAVLNEAGLVRCEQQGRQRIYSLEPSGLKALRDWLDALWAASLDGYVDAASKAERDER